VRRVGRLALGAGEVARRSGSGWCWADPFGADQLGKDLLHVTSVGELLVSVGDAEVSKSSL
jgi:hypothetical protein